MIEFSFVSEIIKDNYSSTMGRTAEDVIRMFKFLLLKNHFKLSDRGLVERTKTDMLFKYFLGYNPEDTKLINPSLLTVFRRERLKDGEENLLDKLIEKTVELTIKENLDFCEDRSIKNVSKLSEQVLHGNRKEEDKFEYNKDAKMYVCPAGHMAISKRKGGSKKDKNGYDTEVETYFFDVEKCKHCPFKNGCYKDGAKSKTYSVKIKDDTHIKQMDYMKSDEFEKLYKERYKIEAKNGELKICYGYDKANACGKLGITIQGATTLFLANMKRIIKLKEAKLEKNEQGI